MEGDDYVSQHFEYPVFRELGEPVGRGLPEVA